jgi:hypothetical protein
MRWGILWAVTAVISLTFFQNGVGAQQLDCSLASGPTIQAICGDAELGDLANRAQTWRNQARQDAQDFDYFASRRERCSADVACITRELHAEIAELQVGLGAAPQALADGGRRAPNESLPAEVATASADDLRGFMEQIVQLDSRGWMINRYDSGSMHDVLAESRNSDQSSAVVRGAYTFNNGRRGWVRARIERGLVSCVEYWDFSGRCRPVGQSYSYQLLAGLAVAAMVAGAGSASSAGGSSNNSAYDAQAHQQACQAGGCGPSH